MSGRTDSAASASLRPYFEDDGVTIYHGRAEDILPQLGEQVDLIFTSPPYNLGVTKDRFGHGAGYAGGRWRAAQADRKGVRYDEHEDAMPPAEYAEWQRDVLAACWDRLTDDGAIFYNHKPQTRASTLWLPTDLNPGLPLRQIVTWARAGGINCTPTHFCPMYEWLLVFAKPAWRLKSQSASAVGDVWYVPQEPSPHPAPFPSGLPAGRNAGVQVVRQACPCRVTLPSYPDRGDAPAAWRSDALVHLLQAARGGAGGCRVTQDARSAAKCPNCHGTGNTRFGVCAYCKGTGTA